MNLTELFIANNPITKNDEFMTKVDFFLPNIVKVVSKKQFQLYVELAFTNQISIKIRMANTLETYFHR